MLADLLKQTALRALPGPMGTLQALRRQQHNDGVERRLGLPQIAQQCAERLQRVVQSGPFAGMQYVPRAIGSAFVPKLVGCYEQELHPILEHILATNYPIVVDIGCAEGYYAVGLARQMRAAFVFAFDTDPNARRLCLEMAAINGVAEQVIVSGACDAARLAGLLSERALVICDCEGFERELLRPELIPGLRGADILVELHDAFSPGLSAEVLGRFAATHDVLCVSACPRDPNDYPLLAFLEDPQRRLAVSEFRPEDQQWAFLTARHIGQEGATG